MMSHEEHQPGEEEDGEDEEGDIEARTAVEALLALTSPTDYTHHTAYEDDYIMEPEPDDYSEKLVSGKEMLGVYNVASEPTEMQLEDNRVGVVRQPLAVHIENTNVEAVTDMQVTVCTSEPCVTDNELHLSEESNPSTVFVPATTRQDADDGLNQLKAFVQATEGRKEETITKVPETESQGIYDEESNSGYENYQTHSHLSHEEEKLPEPHREKSTASVTLPVKTACDSSTTRQCDTTSLTCLTEKEGPLEKYSGPATVCTGGRYVYKKGVKKVQVSGEISRGFVNPYERHKSLSQTYEQTKGAINVGKVMKPCEDNSKVESQNTSEGIKTEASGDVGDKNVPNEANSDCSDSENDSDDSDGDSDSSSSSSGSDSSSSDSDSDGSDSDSDSDSDSKSTEESEKLPEIPEQQRKDVENNEQRVKEPLDHIDGISNKTSISTEKEKISDIKNCQREEKFEGKDIDKSIDLKPREVPPLSNINTDNLEKVEDGDKCTKVIEQTSKDFEVSACTKVEKKVPSDKRNCISVRKVASGVGKNAAIRKINDKGKINKENNTNIKENNLSTKNENGKKNSIQVSEQNVKKNTVQVIEQNVRKNSVLVNAQNVKKGNVQGNEQKAKKNSVQVNEQNVKKNSVQVNEQNVKKNSVQVNEQNVKKNSVQVNEQNVKKNSVQVNEQNVKKNSVQVNEQNVKKNSVQVNEQNVKKNSLQVNEQNVKKNSVQVNEQNAKKNSVQVSEQNVTVTKSMPKARRKASFSKSSREKMSEVDLVQQVAVAFAQQLSTIQANQLRGLSEKSLQQGEYTKDYRDEDIDCLNQNSLDDTIPEEEKMESEIDDMFPMPIQAEVVMSEGSESGIEYEGYDRAAPESDDIGWCKKGSEILDQSEKENIELMAYLKSFVNGGGEGEVIEYPPANNIVPSEGSDLTQWQLDGVHLPPFTPNVAPPSWLRLTIPAEGYRCLSCGDTFFIESSLVQHRERRSVWISLECGPCDAKLTFYNRCALKDHLRNHLMQGEEVDEETVEVRSLPLQLTRLLQPILVPVPKSLRLANKKLKRNLKGRGTVNKLPALKPIGRTASKLSEEYLSGSLDDHYGEDESEECTEFGDEDIRSRLNSHKIPSGMKRLSARKRTVRCYLCERMFHSVRELMAHMRTDQPYSDQRVECKKCQLVLPSVCAAKAHILTHPPANTSNMSVCPECGSRCDGPREFVHHLNTCGHQFRRSGIVCTECQVCFFKSQDDFLTHWIAEHCAKSYECVVCRNTFESLVFHKCTSPGQQVLATFRCLLTCPLCSLAVQLHAQGERDTNSKIRAHLADAHPTIITRVHYVYKSKFCTNAFRSKDELRAHHDREHRRDNHYRTKTCTLHHEVLGYQHQYFNGQEPRNAFVTLPVALSAEELHEARIRDVPTVSSVIDKTLFPDVTPQESNKTGKVEKKIKNKVVNKTSPKEVEPNESLGKESPAKKDMDQLDKLRPKVCYRCGYKYVDNKDFRRHKRTCEGEAAERQCEICGMVAVSEDFARHSLGHIQDGAVLCIYCNGTQFSNAIDLEQHFELHVHEQFSYPATCAFCCTSLPDVPTALAHLNEEHDPLHVPFDTSEFECDRCGRRFHGERGLSVHLGRCTLGTATPTPSAGCRQCQVCTKALTPEMFGRHLVCHLEEGLLVCSLCDGRTLPSSMALLHHLEEHAAALSYPNPCPMCSFVMEDASSALTHLKEEHGFGNLHCAECDMHFNFTYQLQRHTDIVHKICQYAKRRYICWICRAYDHVKKETLMNHFRTVHGLDREQVDEKVMIRTRGQGTMPTSQFIPTKPLGSKENPGGSSTSKTDADTPLLKIQKDKAKGSPGKASSVTESSVKPSSNKSSQGSPVKSSPSKTITSSGSKKVWTRRTDSKLNDKTKVLIKRLPDSILDEQSRSKRRKRVSRTDEVKIEPGAEVKKEKKRKKKKKAFRCNICTFGTNSKEKLDNHIVKHKQLSEEAEPDGFVCRECGASFVVEPSLARHMFFAHKVKLQVSSADENEDNDKNVVDVKGKKVVVKEEIDIKEESELSIKEVKVQKDLKEEKVQKIKEEKEPVSSVKKENDVVVAKRKTARVSVKKKLERETLKKRVEGRNKKKAVEGMIKKKVARAITKKKVEKVINRKKIEKVIPRKRTVKDASKRRADKEITANKMEEGDEDKFDNHCVVCKEEFTNPVELYSHLRTHGMAFLKLGRKARPLGLGKPLDR
ncbi:uncharacterized protein LOC121869639 [Homarus americanus]|nr:uncharacterized protein LOC121869639 [Homarus americanus]